MKNILYFMILAMFMIACGGQEEEMTDSVSEETETDFSANLSDIISNDSIKIGPLIHRNVVRTIESSGRVSLPPNGRHAVHPPTEGYISDFNLVSGDVVKKGARLFSISHPGMVEKQRLLLETAAELELAQRDFKRKEELLRSSATSEVSYDEAAAKVSLLSARYEGLQRELELWGIDLAGLLEHGQFQSRVDVASPVRGVIEEVYVHPGQMISPEVTAVNIVDPGNLHLDLQVLARYASLVKLGQNVVFHMAGNQQSYTAQIRHIGPHLNSGNETLTIHAHPNSGDVSRLIPGMFVKAQIQLDSVAVTGLPSEAVVSQGGLQYAYGLENDQIVKTELTSVERIGGLVVFDTLPYQEFVIKGAYYLE